VPWFAKVTEYDAKAILRVSFWAQPFLPQGAGHDQYFFSNLDAHGHAGFASYIGQDGNLTLVVGSDSGPRTARSDIRLARHLWYFLTFAFDTERRTVSVSARSKDSHIVASQTETNSLTVAHSFALASSEILTVASHSSRERVSSAPIQSSTFNGKIESFVIDLITGVESKTILHLDFSKEIPTDRIADVSDGALEGSLINSPTRAVTGHDWDASETCWASASHGYGAIHFHDDDVDDAAWSTDFELSLPKDLPSGCYGVVLNDGESEDIVPFFVRPDLDSSPVNKVAFIFPTFTYTAYANDRMYDTSRDVHIDIPGSDSVHRSHHIDILEARPDLGISLYDSHNDGSGTTHSSTKRVVLNMRPK
jgi:hypothetical protein